MATDTVIVVANNAIPVANAGADKQITCNSSTISLSGSSSTPGAIFSWSAISGGNIVSGGTSATPVVNAAGCYVLSVTNPSSGCVNSDTTCVVINTNVPVVSGETQVNVACYAACTGSINFAVSGGQLPYTYNWSSGASSQSLSNICSGIYTVTITGSNACTATSTFTITQPTATLTSSVTVTQNVSCNGGANGVATATGNGGTAPYSYNWNTGSTTASLTGVGAGNYSVTITDQNGCTSQSNATISQPSAAASVSLFVSPHVYCYGGSNGVIYSTPSGGTSPYTYLWNTGATTQNLSGISTGNYTVTLTDANGCSTLQSITVTQPPGPLVSTPSMSQSVGCFGGSTGSATVMASGGTAPYSYSWSNGSTSTAISNLTAGIYTITVTDAYGCTTVNSTSVTQPSAALSSSITSSQNINCFGGNNGSVNLSVNGGTAPYSYNWSNGATTQDISNLVSGTYTVTVTDNRGCTAASTTTLTQPSGILNATAVASQNVSCFGGNNGTATLTVSGGTAPFIYSWSNGATSQNLSGLTDGAYTVTVTDVNGCIKSTSVTISQPSAALSSVLAVTQNISCYGGNNGSIANTVTGGTAAYSYSWSNGETSQNLSGLTAGTYTVTVTDINGCSVTRNTTISQPSAGISGTLEMSQAVSCYSGSNGALNFTVTGGTLPFTYAWSNGATSEDISGVTAGTYTVTVTDANNCTLSFTGTVTQPAAALATTITSSQNVNCFGGNTGAINLTVTNGTAPYTYNWSNGAITQDLSALSTGTYSVTVTDANGCTSSKSVTITQPSATLSSSAVIDQNVSCFGGNNGSVNLSVAGGTPSYSYNWSNGQTSQDLSGLGSGNYTVTLTDQNGCTSTRTITISQPSAALAATATQSQAVSCNSGNNGQLSLAVTGGTAPYSYMWSNGAITQSVNGLVAGTYTVTVTDANGCTKIASATITQPSAALSGTTTTTSNISCFSGNNGSIDLSVAGGTGPFSYMWSNGAITQDLNGLPAGSYNVTITDANGCLANSGGVISQPAGSLAANLSVSQNVNCFGGGNGSLNLTVSGGTSPYNFNWSTGATTEDLNGLAVGFYTVSITDANGCVSSATGSITQPAAALTSSVNTSQNVNCFGGTNGSLDLTVTGGTAPYSYSWSNGATSQDINNLSSGIYTVAITDYNGCTTNQSGLVSQPNAALSASAGASANVSCFGGANGVVNLTVNGGTAPYSYNWSNGELTEDLNGLQAGVYNVTVTDDRGCNTTASATVTEPSAALSITVSSTQAVSCFGGNNGQVAMTVNGGTAPYSYSWNTGATTQNLTNLPSGVYTVTVTDINGCMGTQTAFINQPSAVLNAQSASVQPVLCFSGTNGAIDINVTGGTTPYTYMWSNGTSGEDLSGLSSGTYTINITDANGCTFTLTETITQPSAALSSVTSVTQNVFCNGGNNGSAIIIVSGGTSPYNYVWNNFELTAAISNLTSGWFNVTATDANGCLITDSVEVTQPVAALSAVVNASQNVNCFGGGTGSIDLNVSGGTLPYSFTWNNGEITEDLNNLLAGTYNVNIVDANGCTSAATVTITQPAAALSSMIYGTNNVSCFGGNNGNANMIVSGGTTPYTYIWSNGEITEDLTGLSAGTYSVTVTDANGCVSNATVTISEPSAALNPSLVMSQQVNCFGGENGSIDLTVSGGTLPYSYTWSTGDTTQNIVNLMAGTYVVIVTDANGCEGTAQLTLSQPMAPLLGFITVTSNVFCNGGSNGVLDLNINGGTVPYTFNWSNGATTEDISNLSTGTYTVTVTDANGCSTSITEGIGQPNQQLNALVTVQQILCFNGNNGLVDITPMGGTAPYSFIWNTGAVTEDIGGLFAGTYTVTISDANGCDTTITSVVSQPAAPLVPVLNVAQNVSCFGGNDGNISLAVTGGTPPYVYLWNTGATTAGINGLTAGAYTVTVTDANGCNAIISDFVGQPAQPLTAPVTVSQDVSCFGGSNGSLVSNATGGTAPYTYLWSTGATSSSINGLSNGIYTLTVTDNQGCIFTTDAQVSQPAAPLAVSGSTTIANCLNGQGGSVTIQVSGGTPMYTFLWSNGSASQNISNAMPGSYNVTVTDANGCTVTGNWVVGNNSSYYLSAGPTTICVGETATLVADSIDGGAYQWYFEGSPLNGATGLTFVTPAAGHYFVSVTVPCGTFFSDSIEVIVKSIENASITSDRIICPPEMVHLNATGGITYQWSPTTFMTFSNIPDPIVAPPVSTTYSVLITNEWGCKTTLEVDITVACDSLLIPNGFSPNDDGTNDGYVIDGIENYPGNKLWVYNRWGNLVFKAKDYDNSWDGVCNVSGIYLGRKVPTGTYYFILDLNDHSKPRAGFLIIRR
ncbi:MAG: gliding motility-associated C-terminal domain-containing protein [Bacteroidota bacterium]|nr:gliding motility-associated C-terminal domain-containing protein [Bacteroidota bacterium]